MALANIRKKVFAFATKIDATQNLEFAVKYLEFNTQNLEFFVLMTFAAQNLEFFVHLEFVFVVLQRIVFFVSSTLRIQLKPELLLDV